MAHSPAQSQQAGSGPNHPGFPQVFGKYVLVRPMARGGMGELFLAAAGETGGFEKMCVVKKVLHSVEDQGVHRRFLDEAKVVVRLNHPNLVQVFDAGRVDDEYYLTMELVEGKDLRAVWNRCAQLHRRIAVDVSIFVIREVLRGLEYAHDAGSLDLVHRDISPPNILVGYRGDVKLTDFGLAKSAIKREMTTPGVVFGRYSYLSPEQARGLAADRRTDIYATGIVLWELLTGRQLFPSAGRNHQEALAAVRDPKVKPPSTLVPGVPEGLDDVVLQSLAKDPRERFQNGRAFRVALSDVLSTHFPKADADRTSEFMRDIFAREVRVEGRDIASMTQQDYTELRGAADHTDSISVSDMLDGEERSTMDLAESDIVELQHVRRNAEPPSTADLRQSAKAWIGQIVAQRYRIDGLIGIGGMGAVFRATHMALGKTYALKVLHQVYTRDADIVDRFMREARAATQTGHPNIIDVVDIGTTADEDVYFVMELLEGQTVAGVVADEGPLAVRRAVHIARQVCRALAAAHEVGIIHRDLKSDNIVLITRGKDPDFVKVLDFGICKTSGADAMTTSPGLVMGSPDYMAPEQGAGLEATVSSDVYAVGCVLYELLGGRLPFTGRNAIDVLMQKGAREAEPITKIRTEVPEPLADVVARCLLRDPEARPPSMRALEYELTRAVDGRASAVAAVLGLNMAGDSGPRSAEDSGPGASGSFHRAAIASLDGGPPRASLSRSEHTEIAPHPSRPPSMSTSSVHTVIAPPPRRPEPQLSKANATALAVAKALGFVALGGVLATVLVLGLSGDDDGGKAAGARSSVVDRSGDAGPPAALDAGEDQGELGMGDPAEGAADDAGGSVPAGDGAAASADAGADAGQGGEEGDDEPIIVDDDPTPTPSVATPTTKPELVARAEAALETRQWREPVDGSLTMALTNLGLLDPGHEAIGRLRKAAAEILVPLGVEALDKKRWTEAAAAYRDLKAVWPDHPGARAQLIEALEQQGRVLKRTKDWEGALASADELLNLQPEEYNALMLQGYALGKLGRWSEAKDSYGRARKVKPRSKAAKKAFWQAAKKARNERG